MAFDEKIREYTHRLLYVAPIYGWGWWEFDAAGWVDYTPEQSAGPAPFYLRVDQFYTYAGVLQGAVGKVETEGHPYDGLFAVFYLHRGLEKPANFTANIADYNIQFGPDKPTLGEHPPDQDNDWPLWVFSGRPYLGGFAHIAENAEMIDRYQRQIGIKV